MKISTNFIVRNSQSFLIVFGEFLNLCETSKASRRQKLRPKANQSGKITILNSIFYQKKMLDQVLIVTSQAKGAIIGATTGAIHETFIVIRKKSRIATFWNYFLAMILSGFVGWISFELLKESGIDGAYRVLWTVILSLNSYLVFQIFTNPSFLFGLIKIYAPRIKIPEEEMKKFEENISKKDDNS